MLTEHGMTFYPEKESFSAVRKKIESEAEEKVSLLIHYPKPSYISTIADESCMEIKTE
jgi:hypothetical protein